MLDEKNRTLHASRNPSPSVQFRASLLPLRMALTTAEKESPARPAPQITADEKRAMILIEKMKTEYNKPLPFANFVQRTSKRHCGALATSQTLAASNTKLGDFVLRIQQGMIHA